MGEKNRGKTGISAESALRRAVPPRKSRCQARREPLPRRASPQILQESRGAEARPEQPRAERGSAASPLARRRESKNPSGEGKRLPYLAAAAPNPAFPEVYSQGGRSLLGGARGERARLPKKTPKARRSCASQGCRFSSASLPSSTVTFKCIFYCCGTLYLQIIKSTSSAYRDCPDITVL